jgi:hypothetical protein
LKHLHFTVSPRQTFEVSGFADFPGEITSVITSLIWGDVKASEQEFRMDFDRVWAVVYDGVFNVEGLSPAVEQMLIDFRIFLQRLETEQEGADGSVHIMSNLNAGMFIAFKGNIDR